MFLLKIWVKLLQTCWRRTKLGIILLKLNIQVQDLVDLNQIIVVVRCCKKNSTSFDKQIKFYSKKKGNTGPEEQHQQKPRIKSPQNKIV